MRRKVFVRYAIDAQTSEKGRSAADLVTVLQGGEETGGDSGSTTQLFYKKSPFHRYLFIFTPEFVVSRAKKAAVLLGQAVSCWLLGFQPEWGDERDASALSVFTGSGLSVGPGLLRGVGPAALLSIVLLKSYVQT